MGVGETTNRTGNDENNLNTQRRQRRHFEYVRIS